VSGTRVTCTDIDSGESQTEEIANNYILVTDGRCYLDGVVEHANGTTILTVKRRPVPDRTTTEPTETEERQ
jgi:hypothetical protein